MFDDCSKFPYNNPNSCVPVKIHNLRIVIVTTDIHQGLYNMQSIKINHPSHLTFWHWSGVTPYTSSCELAGSYVFGKQSPGSLSLRPPFNGGRALSLTYGRFFAEFLEDLSLVRLGLLDLTTCVGLGYGTNIFKLRRFSWKRAPLNFPPKKNFRCALT